MSTEVTIEMMIESARPHYDAELAYHNFDGHARSVLDKTTFLARQLAERGFSLLLEPLQVAAAWHDAGFSEDHQALGFETKEHYSAYLADEYLLSIGADEEFRQLVTEAIIGTIHGKQRSTIYELLLHRADISNIGGLYTTFYKNNLAVRQEAEYFDQPLPDWPAWKDSTVHFIDFTVDEARREIPALQDLQGIPLQNSSSLSLGGFMSFDTLAIKNRDLFINEPEPKQRTFR